MKRKLKRVLELLREGKYCELWNKCVDVLKDRIYRLRARLEDWRMGRISINKTLPTKFAEQGAYGTQSTDYRCLDRIFGSLPLKDDDIFVDVGCGEGRVLTYLYLRKCRISMTGIELDPDVVGTARRRTEKCRNISIINGNVLEQQNIIQRATAIYIFNPFDENITEQFIKMIEDNCNHPVVLYYCYDIYRKLLDKREKWSILRRDMIVRPRMKRIPYSIYRYMPE